MTGVARRPVAERLRRWLIARCSPITIDGQTVQSITIDGEDVTEVTMDGQTVFKSNAIPDSVVDNFEDADADPAGVYESGETLADYYSGELSDYSRDTNIVESGDKALLYQNDSASNSIASTSGLNTYPDLGDTFECRVYSKSGAAAFVGWFAQSETSFPDGYVADVRETDSEFRFRKVSGGSISDIETVTGVSIPSEEWLRVEVDSATDNSYTLTLENASGSQLAQINNSDSEFTSGGIFFLGSHGGGGEIRFDEYSIL